MVYTFETYTQELHSLSIEEMQEIHTQIVDGIQGDKDAEEIYEEVLKKATRYNDFRVNWYLWDREKRIEKDDLRTSCHDSFISNINMLSRWLKKQGKETTWRDELGDDRKRIGDFACYLAFVNALEAR